MLVKKFFTKKYFVWFFLLVGLWSAAFFVSVNSVNAQNYNVNTPVIKDSIDIEKAVQNGINFFMGILTTVAVVFILYGGFRYMTAAGNKEKVDKAKKTLINACIGLVIVLSAWLIVRLIFGLFGGNTGEPCDTEGASRLNTLSCCGGANLIDVEEICTDGYWKSTGGSCAGIDCGDIEDLGAFNVTWKKPSNMQKNVSLCSMILVGFNKAIDPEAASASGDSDAQMFLKKCNTGDDPNCVGAALVDGQVIVVKDILKFTPDTDLEPLTWYKVVVDGSLLSGSGDMTLGTDEEWLFKTGDNTDNIPPTIVAKDPGAGATDVCLNESLQMKFSEDMDMTTVGAPANLLSVPSMAWNWKANSSILASWSPDPKFTGDTTYTNTAKGSAMSRDEWRAASFDINQGMRDMCGNPMAADDTWSFSTLQRTECYPVITGIEPTSSYYGGNDSTADDIVKITGQYFKLGGNIIFNKERAAGDDDCFVCNGEFCIPSNDCLVSWNTGGSQEIKVKVPSMAINGAIKVSITDERQASSPNFEILSPHINYISGFNGRAQGNTGQMLAISGVNFGTSGQVKFIKNYSSFVLAGDLPANCPDSWTDNQIIVTVPDGLNADDTISIQVISDQPAGILERRASNLALFRKTSDPLGPGICAINPVCAGLSCAGGSVGEAREVIGKQFGSVVDTLIFKKNVEVAAATTAWSDNLINTAVPSGVGVGDNRVLVTVDELTSNYFTFRVPCDKLSCDSDPTTVRCEPGACPTGYICDSYCNCNKTLGITQTWPQNNCSEACINTAVKVKFDQDLDPLTSNINSNIVLWQCADATCNTGMVIASSIDFEGSDNRTVKLSPNVNLNRNTWYRVLIKGTSSGVKTVVIGENPVRFLGSLNFPVGTPEFYSWKFKTRDVATVCQADSVELLPAIQTATEVGQKKTFKANASASDNCNNAPLSAFSLSYRWSFYNASVGALEACTIPSEACRQVKALGEGESTIKAALTSASAVFGQARFIVDLSGIPVSCTYSCTSDADCASAGTNYGCGRGCCFPAPKLINISPAKGETNICRNIGVMGTFDKTINNSRTLKENFKLYPVVDPTAEVSVNFSLETDTTAGQSVFHLYPGNCQLENNTEYQIEIKKSGVISSDGVAIKQCGAVSDESTVNDSCIINFRTDDSFCTINKIKVSPSSQKTIAVAETLDYQAHSFNDRYNVCTNECLWNINPMSVASVLATTNSCQPRVTGLAEGEAAVVASAVTTPSNVSCEASETCGKIKVVRGAPIGSSCGGVGTCAGSGRCSSGLHCDETTCKCEAGPGIGDACFVGGLPGSCTGVDNCPIEDGLSCETSSCTCQYQTPKITTITSPYQCTNGVIKINFNTLLNKTSLSADAIQLRNSAGEIIATRLSSIQNIDTDSPADGQADATSVILVPNTSLNAGTNYNVTLTNGIRSIYGITVDPTDSDNTRTFNLNSAAYFCHLGHATWNPDTANLRSRNETQFFDLIPMAANGELLSMGGLGSAAGLGWKAEVLQSLNLVEMTEFSPDDFRIYPQISLKTLNINGNAQVTGILTDSPGESSSSLVTAVLPIDIFLCENPGEFIFVDAAGNETSRSLVFTGLGNNASTRFCRDYGKNNDTSDDLPDLRVRAGDPVGDADFWTNSHWLMSATDLTGVLGAMSFRNPGYLKPATWFKNKYGTNASGGNFEVGGYPALREGRSVYVGATNVYCGTGVSTAKIENKTESGWWKNLASWWLGHFSKLKNLLGVVKAAGTCSLNTTTGFCSGGSDCQRHIDTNMQLLSYSENSDTKMQNIYNQLLDNLTFNKNLITTVAGQEVQKRIIRDLRRLYDLRTISDALEVYKTSKGTYPQLTGGTYLVGKSTSIWPSWQETLASVLGGNLPVDPINKLAWPGRNADDTCNPAPAGYIGYTDEAIAGICFPSSFSTDTGWSESLREFKCPPPASYFYMYQALPDTNDYGLYANMEYFLDSDFDSTYLTVTGSFAPPCTGSGCPLNFRLGRSDGNTPVSNCNGLLDGVCPVGCSSVNDPDCLCNSNFSDGICNQPPCSRLNDYDCYLKYLAQEDDYLDIIVDTNIPTVAFSGAPVNWTKNPVTLGVTCSVPSGSCIDSTKRLLKINSGETCPFDTTQYILTPPQTVTAESYYCATAKSANLLSGFSNPFQIKVDQIAPVVNNKNLKLSASGSNMNPTSRTLTFCSDTKPKLSWDILSDTGGSGLKEIQIWRKSTSWPTTPQATLNDVSALDWSETTNLIPGNYDYGIHVLDNAGNCATESGTCGDGSDDKLVHAIVESCVPRPLTVKKTVGTTRTVDTLGLITDSVAGGINCGATCSYNYPYPTASATLTAASTGTGFRFNRWFDCTSASGNVCTKTLNNDGTSVAVEANFIQTWTVSGVSNMSVAGSVNINNPVVDNGGDARLTAVASNSAYTFSNWSAAPGGFCGCDSVNPCNLTNITSNQKCVANFSVKTYTVNVVADVNGSVNPVSRTINYGDNLSIVANANTGYEFNNWTGICAGQSNPCVLVGGTAPLDSSPKNTTATFKLRKYTLTIVKNGPGSIQCKVGTTGSFGPCSSQYNYNTNLTLRAVGAGSDFSGWGGACSGNGDCNLVINGEKSVIANFTVIWNIIINKTQTNPGDGKINFQNGASAPIAMLGNTQTFSAQQGNNVSLTPIGGQYNVFDHWNDTAPCSSITSNVCYINNISGNKNLSAVFKDGVAPKINQFKFGNNQNTKCSVAGSNLENIQFSFEDLPEGEDTRYEIWQSFDNGATWSERERGTVTTPSYYMNIVSPGTYKFGLHLVDEAGNCITEQGLRCDGLTHRDYYDINYPRQAFSTLTLNKCAAGEMCSGSGECRSLPTGKIVFVTGGTVVNSSMENGVTDGRIWHDTSVGVDAADAICNHLATQAGITGRTFKAWLSGTKSTGIYSPFLTFNKSLTPYYLMDGTIMANNWNDIIRNPNADGEVTVRLKHSINITENSDILISGNVWTGTNVDSNKHYCDIPANNNFICGTNWDVNDSFATPVGKCNGTNRSGMGSVSFFNKFWTKDVMVYKIGDTVNQNCSQKAHLYCFQQ